MLLALLPMAIAMIGERPAPRAWLVETGAMLLAHPLLLMAGDPDFLAWLDPREGLLRAVTMAGLLAAITALLVTSLWRVQLGLQYETWRSVHALSPRTARLADPWRHSLLPAAASLFDVLG